MVDKTMDEFIIKHSVIPDIIYLNFFKQLFYNSFTNLMLKLKWKSFKTFLNWWILNLEQKNLFLWVFFWLCYIYFILLFFYLCFFYSSHWWQWYDLLLTVKGNNPCIFCFIYLFIYLFIFFFFDVYYIFESWIIKKGTITIDFLFVLCGRAADTLFQTWKI